VKKAKFVLKATSMHLAERNTSSFTLRENSLMCAVEKAQFHDLCNAWRQSCSYESRHHPNDNLWDGLYYVFTCL